MTTGIHHITAISSNAQRTYDFYTGILGLRLIKKTVNFDSPDTYHLYFGNESGNPGTALTFFPFVDAGTGRRGPGLATRIQFAVPSGSLGFWLARFVEKGVKHGRIESKLGFKSLEFKDFDDQMLELVASEHHSQLPAWTGDGIDADNAIRGFFGIELTVNNKQKTEKLISGLLGYQKIAEDEYLTRYAIEGDDVFKKEEKLARHLDIFHMPGWPDGQSGAGVVHHVAFRAKDDNHELALRKSVLEEFELQPTEVIDRHYFHSVYFREPGGILFEIATDQPGFTVDENLAELGTEIKFPPQYADQKKIFLAQLPELHTKGAKDLNIDIPEFDFTHRFLTKNNDYTFLLLHGTGGDEYDLLQLAVYLNPDYNILTLRGNINENGMLRFFARTEEGEFIRESLDTETNKLKNFIEQSIDFYEINPEKIIVLGYSNGANIALSLMIQNPGLIENLIAMHPMQPFELDEFTPDLTEAKILITSGQQDPYPQEGELENLDKTLATWGAETQLFKHTGGHEIRPIELDQAKVFLESITKSTE